jgi:radical SAM superfamily enzyme YgiQ (UPF0313 family)
MPIEMVIHDRVAAGFNHTTEVPAREPDYDGPVTYYSGVEYGEGADATAAFVRSHPEARIVALPALFSASRNQVVDTARIVKKVRPDLLVVTGGAYATSDYHFLLEKGYVDAVVMYEAWLTFPAVVHTFLRDGILNGVPGIVYRDQGGHLIDNTRMGSHYYPRVCHHDSLPMPAWDLLDFRVYDRIGLTHLGDTPPGQFIAPIDSEIGCGLTCKFCTAGQVNAGHILAKSANRVYDEVRTLAEEFGRNSIQFDSDNSLFDCNRALRLFQRLSSYNRQRRRRNTEEVRFAFPNAAPPGKLLNADLVSVMIEAGLHHMAIAVESASPRVLRPLGKSPSVPHLAREAVRLIRECEKRANLPERPPVMVEVFVIVGTPDESADDLQTTLAYCEELNRDYGVVVTPFFFAPLHGAPLCRDFFRENPKAKKLAWSVLGWLGTEKSDSARANELTAEARNHLLALPRPTAAAGLVRL